ncbi:unnamed protein product [Pleuronectes platessa]|uniref:non-specific serine/threonine protein kinase n=1 Tax=Pleuronectes platessa TaxID=8262 RepID=A0A9N7VER1_PLEPL|nr:unnamed protein product [Pleuronectes platessa]
MLMLDWKSLCLKSELWGICQRRERHLWTLEFISQKSQKTAPTRSNSGNGRSTNGETIVGSSRSSGCSYLSNVRPETRSTFSSVMAQLTEETQPSFETTLKSKAVSEKCNVKFSCVVTGFPTPQVTWYKDDVQLDRYCGLPKYEIFRNGQNYSLHIYNCTVEDAAIYQASAINSKGIVSCSGVLEVGEMNEFKIHQRYFAKLKQKAENRRREAEGKENQEPLRTISPDRAQRKRRSTMEAFLSTPSSTEEEATEENQQAVAAVTEARLQEATVEEVEEKPVTNGQVVTENGSKGGTYTYDGQTVSGPEDNHVAKHVNEAGLKSQEENVETQKQSPNLNLNMSSTRQSRVASTNLRTTKKDGLLRPSVHVNRLEISRLRRKHAPSKKVCPRRDPSQRVRLLRPVQRRTGMMHLSASGLHPARVRCRPNSHIRLLQKDRRRGMTCRPRLCSVVFKHLLAR